MCSAKTCRCRCAYCAARRSNVTWRFQRFREARGVLLCPHAKTSMSPALFGRQLGAGCWGLTFATCAQLKVARRHGVQRVFYANQLVGAADIRYVCDELRRDPGFEFYCLVDSVGGVQQLAQRVAQADPGRRLNVLIEGGLAGGRCGVRDVGTAVTVAEAVRTAGAHLALAPGRRPRMRRYTRRSRGLRSQRAGPPWPGAAGPPARREWFPARPGLAAGAIWKVVAERRIVLSLSGRHPRSAARRDGSGAPRPASARRVPAGACR